MNLRIPTLAALAVVQVLATSCGGGGGSGDSVVFGDLFSALVERVDPNPTHLVATQKLAEAVPRRGSVSQSSNVNTDPNDPPNLGVTADAVAVEGLGDAASSLALVTISVSGGNVSITLSVANADEDFIRGSTATFIRRDNTAIAAAAVSVSFDLPGGTDWAAVGIWYYTEIETDVTADRHFGVFADSYTPGGVTLPQRGEFRYEGTSVGYLVTETQSEADDGTPVVAHDFLGFDAEVVLEADFDDEKISGNIRNIHDFSNDPDAENYFIVLEDADIDNENFFKGKVSFETETGATAEDGEFAKGGNWGGEFFGEDAEGVLGTYGGHLDDETFIGLIAPDSDLLQISFAGAFIAVNE